MSATSLTRSYDSLLTTTADNYYKNGLVQDAIFESNPTFKALKGKGFRNEMTGGSKIQVNLMYGKNETVGSYSRYEALNVAPQDGMTPAFYDWAQYSGSVSIDGLSKFQNSGKPAIQKLLREKVKQLTMSFTEKMNEDLWDIEGLSAAGATGNSGKNIVSIPLIIQGDPTGGVDVGSIDQSAESWWQNKTQNSGTESSGTFQMLEDEMRHLYNTLSRGSGGSPDLLIANQHVFEAYERGMNEKVRYSFTDTASVGFENIKFGSSKLFWDYHVPDPDGGYNYDSGSYAGTTGGAVYMINSNFLDFVVGSGFDFKPQGFQTPVDQDASTGLWLFYGQLVCSNRRKQGVLEDITSTMTS